MFLIGFFTRRYAENELIYKFLFVNSISFIGIFFLPNWIFFVILLIPYIISSSLISTCITTILTKIVKKEEIGISLGTADSLESLCRIITPTLSSILLEFHKTLFLVLCFFLTIFLSIYTWFYFPNIENNNNKELWLLIAEEENNFSPQQNNK